MFQNIFKELQLSSYYCLFVTSNRYRMTVMLWKCLITSYVFSDIKSLSRPANTNGARAHENLPIQVFKHFIKRVIESSL